MFDLVFCAPLRENVTVRLHLLFFFGLRSSVSNWKLLTNGARRMWGTMRYEQARILSESAKSLQQATSLDTTGFEYIPWSDSVSGMKSKILWQKMQKWRFS